MNKFNSPTEIKELLEQYGKSVKKSLGQNYLINKNVCDAIAAAVNKCYEPERHIIEIGPGLGALTGVLLDNNFLVDAIEIDNLSADILSDRFGGDARFTLIRGDYMEQLSQFSAEKPNLIKEKSPVSIVGNLPYYITTDIVIETLFAIKKGDGVKNLVFMMQKEVAERILSPSCSKIYGITSVFSQCFCDVSRVINVKAGSFYPAPNVDSTVLNFQLKENPPNLENKELFRNLVRCAFNQRRKKLPNAVESSSQLPAFEAAFRGFSVPEFFEKYPKYNEKRAEELNWSSFVEISNEMGKNRG